jgi:hypothetical protein
MIRVLLVALALLLLAPREAQAATVLTAIGAAVTAAKATVLGSVLLRVATGLVVNFVANKLAKKPSKPGDAPDRGFLVVARDSTAPQEYVYGTIRKAGVETYVESTGADNRFVHKIICLAGHEIDGIDAYYFNHEKWSVDGAGMVSNGPYAGKIRIKAHLGSDDQTVDPDLLAESNQIDSNFRGRGIAYLYVRFEFDQDVFAGGLPEITAVVRGKKVYDPRSSVTQYSANFALCARDYLVSDYGLNDPAVDDTMLQVSANVSDEAVPKVGGGTQPRYQIHGAFRADERPVDVLADMMTAGGGDLWFGQGNWSLKAAHYTPPVMDLTLDDFRGPISGQTRANLRDGFNQVGGTFNDAAQDWVPTEYPEISSTVFLAEDGGDQRRLDFEQRFTTDAAAGQRLAKLALFRGREQIRFAAEFSLKALELQVGDTVTLTIDRYGWTAKVFEVAAWAFLNDEQKGARVRLALRETSAEAFEWDAEESELIANNTNLPSYTFVPSVGVNVSTEMQVAQEKLISIFYVDVTSTYPDYVSSVEVQYKPNAASDWIGIGGNGALGRYELRDVEPGVYDFRARAINQFGVRSDWTPAVDIPAAENTTVPTDVTGLDYEISGGMLRLYWDASPDGDLSFYRVRHAVEEAGAEWHYANTIEDKVPRPATSVVVPLRAGTFMVKAYDKGNLVAANPASIVVTADQLPVYATTLDQIEHTAFSGAKSGCSVDGLNRLRIIDPSTGPSEATYEFSGVIDTSAARLVRATSFARVVRLNDGAGLFDDTPGLFDSAPGLFDDMGGDGQFADCNVDVEISTTPDDPSGSPTWSAWKRFRAGDHYGRAFRFRAILRSTTDQVTPAVSELSARVEY